MADGRTPSHLGTKRILKNPSTLKPKQTSLKARKHPRLMGSYQDQSSTAQFLTENPNQQGYAVFVQPRCRLVEQHQRWTVKEGASKANSLSLASRVAPKGPLGKLTQLKALRRLAKAALRVETVQPCSKTDNVATTHLRVDQTIVRNPSNLAANSRPVQMIPVDHLTR